MLEDRPQNPRILDVGCGPRMQSIELAKMSNGKIDALDNQQLFLADLKRRAEKEGVSGKINALVGDMFSLSYADDSFDLI